MDKSVVLFIFGSLWTVIQIAFGWVLKMFNDRLKTVEDNHSELPDTYARRDDVKDMKLELVGMLRRIEDKLDRKHG